MPTTDYILEIKHLCKQYDASLPDGRALPVLVDLCLQLRHGKTVAIVGPSGSGKSTLLNIVGTIDQSTAGEVILAGQDIANLGDADAARIRNQDIGIIFQEHHLFPQFSVIENLLLPTLARKRQTTDDEKRRAAELLKRVSLETKAHQYPAQLSGGERQRVAVARALINQPRLIVADEPTGSLDTETAGQVSDLLLELNFEQGTALMIVTHSMSLANKMDRVLQLDQGRLYDNAVKSSDLR